jgi:type VI secretion system (T6SS) effector TldE1-like protein
LVRVGVVSVAAGVAGLTAIFSSCAWVVHAPATTGSRAEAAVVRAASTDGTFEQRFAAATDESEIETNAIEAHARGERPSFDDRFSFDQSRDQSAPREASLSFEDRFGAATTLTRRVTAPADSAPLITAMLTVPATPLPTAAPAPAPAAQPRAAAPKAAPQPAVAQAAPKASSKPAGSYRLASLGDTPAPTAYAPANSPIRDSGITDLLRKMARRDSATSGAAPADANATDAAKDANPLGDMSKTAIYDISAKTVYLPSGQRLEAHSGLGGYMDDVRSVNIKSRGPTPPNVYDLTMRESLFHGIQAIRLNPVDGGLMYGRDGILAHPFMLGPNGQSNGCVSLKDYGAFLAAFQRGEFNRLVVVERLDDPPASRTAGEWLKNTLSGIFGRS